MTNQTRMERIDGNEARDDPGRQAGEPGQGSGRRRLAAVVTVVAMAGLMGWLVGPFSLRGGPAASGDADLAARVRAATDDDRGYQALHVSEITATSVRHAGLGSTNPGGRHALTAATPIELGSITKTFDGIVVTNSTRPVDPLAIRLLTGATDGPASTRPPTPVTGLTVTALALLLIAGVAVAAYRATTRLQLVRATVGVVLGLSVLRIAGPWDQAPGPLWALAVTVTVAVAVAVATVTIGVQRVRTRPWHRPRRAALSEERAAPDVTPASPDVTPASPDVTPASGAEPATGATSAVDGAVDVAAGSRATYAAFIATGFAFASWASRIPQVRDRLQLDSAGLGLVLLAIAAGALIALPLSGLIIGHVGSRRTVATLAVVDGVALGVVAFGYQVSVVPVAVGLFLFGFAQGGWDVAMNVQGAAVERRLGRPVMPRFHAGFSIGTVGGALIGAVMVALAVPVSVHLLVVAVLVAVGVPVAVRGFLPDVEGSDGEGSDGEGPDGEGSGGGRRGALRGLAAWREPRTLLVGLVVLVFAFAEGTGNDWTGVALIDGYRVEPWVGTLGLAVFLAAMTAGRWVGPAVLQRWGRVRTLRVTAVAGMAGIALVVAGGSVPVAFAGLVLWGVGVSLGFPVGMSAGADQPSMAAPRVSVISSIGYCAFLAGPPVIGFLAERATLLQAMTSVAVLLGVAVLLVGVVRPLPADDALPAGSGVDTATRP